MNLEFQFLTSGPVFRAVVPDEFGGLPELSTPVVSGVGARSWVFSPGEAGRRLAEGMTSQGDELHRKIDREGHSVSVLERHEPPKLWWLLWRLGNGSLTTHLREFDGLDRVDTIIRYTSVMEGPTGPVVVLDDPLFSVTSTFPGYQEYAVWADVDTGSRLKFVRPGLVPEGKLATTTPEGGRPMFRAGLEGDVEVQFVAPGDLADHREEFLDVVDSVQIG